MNTGKIHRKNETGNAIKPVRYTKKYHTVASIPTLMSPGLPHGHDSPAPNVLHVAT